MSIKISQKFKELIPPLADEERSLLEERVLTEGCRDSLVTWNGILIDGHHRYAICQKHNISFSTSEMNFIDEADAMLWIVKNQFARRNLSNFARAELALKLEPVIAKKAKQNQKSGGGSGSSGRQKSDKPEDTKKQLAKIAGVSHDTINRARALQEKASDETKQALRKGETSINAEYKRLNTHVGHNSGEQEWYTPPEYIEAAREVLCEIDLDPASCQIAQETIQAQTFYTKQDDGLNRLWSGRVWLNPPYASGLIDQFIGKLVISYTEGQVAEAITLTNNSTDTKWFQSLMSHASSVCFTRGRVTFLNSASEPAGKPLQGQAIAYLGDRPGDFEERFSQFGSCARPTNIDRPAGKMTGNE